jgi:hypothetical protein
LFFLAKIVWQRDLDQVQFVVVGGFFLGQSRLLTSDTEGPGAVDDSLVDDSEHFHAGFEFVVLNDAVFAGRSCHVEYLLGC